MKLKDVNEYIKAENNREIDFLSEELKYNIRERAVLESDEESIFEEIFKLSSSENDSVELKAKKIATLNMFVEELTSRQNVGSIYFFQCLTNENISEKLSEDNVDNLVRKMCEKSVTAHFFVGVLISGCFGKRTKKSLYITRLTITFAALKDANAIGTLLCDPKYLDIASQEDIDCLTNTLAEIGKLRVAVQVLANPDYMKKAAFDNISKLSDVIVNNDRWYEEAYQLLNDNRVYICYAGTKNITKLVNIIAKSKKHNIICKVLNKCLNDITPIDIDALTEALAKTKHAESIKQTLTHNKYLHKTTPANITCLTNALAETKNADAIAEVLVDPVFLLVAGPDDITTLTVALTKTKRTNLVLTLLSSFYPRYATSDNISTLIDFIITWKDFSSIELILCFRKLLAMLQPQNITDLINCLVNNMVEEQNIINIFRNKDVFEYFTDDNVSVLLKGLNLVDGNQEVVTTKYSLIIHLINEYDRFPSLWAYYEYFKNTLSAENETMINQNAIKLSSEDYGNNIRKFALLDPKEIVNLSFYEIIDTVFMLIDNNNYECINQIIEELGLIVSNKEKHDITKVAIAINLIEYINDMCTSDLTDEYQKTKAM